MATHLLAAGAAAAGFGIGSAAGLAAGWAVAIGLGAGVAVAVLMAMATGRWVANPLTNLAGLAGTAATATADAAATAPGSEASPSGTFLPSLEEAGPDEVRALAGALNQVRSGVNARFVELNREAGLREQILSSMSEGVVLADATGRILYANPAAHDLLSGAATLPSPLRAEGPVELTLRHPRRRELKATCRQLEDGRRLVAMQDVTEAKRIEAMRRDFVADASHELKTPVASILAVAETLETAVEDDPAAVPIFMRTLLSETRRMSALVKDLLDLARLEGRAGERTVVSLSRVVAVETARVRHNAETKGLLLKEEVDDTVRVAGNGEDLSLALRNLLDNALRYTASGQVSVRLFRHDGNAVVEVEDTGPGIPGKDLGRIFERFYRVDRARSRETGGTGLGLSIVRHVVDQHGGRVRVESELGRGSRFIVTLPALPAKSPEE